ncbi:MAG TPA: UDP-N-acetylmuramate--L-alanine ligase, partial [Acidimicrobiales bacterium]|nr:UDP-N-acetylmuramate--L-alanine ligase [Acidimicrobiales bacterium]
MTPDLSFPRRIHVVGIGGAGMSAIATVLVGMGHRVSGSDLRASPGLERLRALGVDVHVGHDPAHGADAELVTVSTAVPRDNPEVTSARDRGASVFTRAEMLAAITRQRRTAAVAGTHAKTTTSSMLALILLETGLRPSFVIGGDLNEIGTGAAWSDGEWLVVEADESDGTFLELDTQLALVTSLEPDHLDHYGSYAALTEAFDRFLEGATETRIVCADQPDLWKLARRRAIGYGLNEESEYRIAALELAPTGSRFELTRHGAVAARVALSVPGAHNAANAAAAATAALEMGLGPDAVGSGLGRFTGVARRYQFRGEAGGVAYVDDYAHLPGEVRVALDTARRSGRTRVVCVFQPHRFTRTASLWQDFGTAFAGADLLVVTDVYGNGEPPIPGVSGKLVVDAVMEADPGRAVADLPGRLELASYLRA